MLDRLANKFTVGDECWEWAACKGRRGYGYFFSDGRNALAHRVMYEVMVGPIPEDFTLDHLCRNRGCVRPSHLEPVTRGENVLRGEGPSAENARRSECIHGHALDGENLYVTPNGRRQCRTCSRRRGARRV